MFSFYPRQVVLFKIAEYLTNFKNIFSEDKKLIPLFEKKFSKITGARYVITTASMRVGLVKTLQFYKNQFPSKDEVIIASYSFYSTFEAIPRNGLKPIFAPIDEKTFTIDPDKIETLVTKKTLGIIITHMHGFSCEMEKIIKIAKKYNIQVFEDCAHAVGVTYKNQHVGTFGDGFFSFGAGKVLTAFGGGAVTTNNKELAVYLLRNSESVFSVKENIATFIKGLVYILVSNPIFSYLVLKPVLLLKTLFKFESSSKVYLTTTKPPEKIARLSSFQASLLLQQLRNGVIKKNYVLRRKIAKVYARKYPIKIKEGDICFQYPVRTKNSRKFILEAWQKNIDVQIDYCSDLLTIKHEEDGRQSVNERKDDVVYISTVPSIPVSQAIQLVQ